MQDNTTQQELRPRAPFKSVLRTYFSFLLYGGITTAIVYIISFALGLVLEYSFYKEEIIEYTSLVLSLVIYPLFMGFKHVENCGYIDEYDGRFNPVGFFGRLSGAAGLMLAVPLMIAANINVLLTYIYDLCYGPSNGICSLISQTVFHKYDGTTPLGIVFGTLAVFAVYLVILMPFYFLGRRHRRRDINFGVKIKVE